ARHEVGPIDRRLVRGIGQRFEEPQQQGAVPLRGLVALEAVLQAEAAHPTSVCPRDVLNQKEAAVLRPANELNAAADHVLGDLADERILYDRGCRPLLLPRVMSRAHLLSLAREQRGEPRGLEHVDRRVDERAALERADENACTTHGDLAWP